MIKLVKLMKKTKKGLIKYFWKKFETKIKNVLIYKYEEIRKILRGEFKGRNSKNDTNLEFLNDVNSEAARLARMEECIRVL